MLVGLALVALATVVATLCSSVDPARAPVVGLVVGSPPSWVIAWVAFSREGDSSWLVAGVFFMLMTVVVSVAAWAVAIAARWGRRQLVASLGPFGRRQERGW